MVTIERTPLPAERRERLLEVLEDGSTHRVDTLAEKLGVTAVTVRRDLALLASQERVLRVRGGVRRITSASSPVSPAGAPARAAVIGMVVPSLRYYWPELVRGARAAAAEHGVTLALRGSTYALTDYRRDVTVLLEAGRLDGLVVAPGLRADDPDLGTWLASLGLPVVLAERDLTSGPFLEPMESVTSDHALGAALAVRHLHGLGHRRVGLMTADTVTARKVRLGWNQACASLGLPLGGTPDVFTKLYSDPTWQEVASTAIQEIKASGTTAMLVHADAEAVAFADLCVQHGLRIPGDLSLIAYDDEVAALATPPLTSVSPPKAEIGRLVIETLLARLVPGGAERPRRRVVVNPALVERESTAAPRA